MTKYLFCLLFLLVGCRTNPVRPTTTPVIDGHPTPVITVTPGTSSQPTRLRIVNGCSQPLWIFYQSGFQGGTMTAPHQQQLAANAHYDYPIPDQGIAGTRFWPGYGCDATGNNCSIGQSGGPASQGFTCPAWGCAPPIDSKFEGTFGCLASVDAGSCLPNPSDPQHRPLPATDGWDTSMVDGFTLPYRVKVSGQCGRGPLNNTIDCTNLPMSVCPTTENISTNGAYPALASVNLRMTAPGDAGVQQAGCYSDCSRLTMNQWNGMNYGPGSPQAVSYCCPTPPMSPAQCRLGPVATGGYTALVHRYCPQVYAYAYDDGTGNWTCNAGTKYEVTFYCPQ